MLYDPSDINDRFHPANPYSVHAENRRRAAEQERRRREAMNAMADDAMADPKVFSIVVALCVLLPLAYVAIDRWAGARGLHTTWTVMNLVFPAWVIWKIARWIVRTVRR